jgi:hypothetical protein
MIFRRRCCALGCCFLHGDYGIAAVQAKAVTANDAAPIRWHPDSTPAAWPRESSQYSDRGPPATRLPLALQLIQLLRKEDLVLWWKAFEDNDAAGFSKMMKSPLKRLKTLEKNNVYDPRTVQLLRDALTWAIVHPKRRGHARREHVV